MRWLRAFTGYLAPIFIIFSPVLSYSDQAYSMHRNKSSAGFSLDIPLIMLVASLFRIFYFPGARFDTALLVQSFIMVVIQVVLLKIALDNRPAPSSKGGELPFAGVQAGGGLMDIPRPYNFWQWRSPKPYWQFLLWIFIGLTLNELLLAPIPFLYPAYSKLIGYTGLLVEATLPLPQILANWRSRSCRGFRFSVLVFWLLGDATKMFWFFTSVTEIPWPFKLCGIFQAGCDLFLGVQYLMYGASDGGMPTPKMQMAGWPGHHKVAGARIASGRGTPTGGRTPLNEKEI